MNKKLAGVALTFALLAGGSAPAFATEVSQETVTQARTESVAGLDASQSELDAIEKKLTVNHDQLSYEYRELNDHIRNKENKESAVTRETIRQLKIERKLLWEQQDSAESMIAMHQADVAAADLAPNWPDVMKEDADNLSNVILFDAISDDITRIRSYGIGYRDRPEYDELLSFFSSANRGLYEKLKRFVED